MAEQSSGSDHVNGINHEQDSSIRTKSEVSSKVMELMEQLSSLEIYGSYEEKMMKIINVWEKLLVIAHSCKDVSKMGLSLYRLTLTHVLDISYESLKAVIKTHLLMTMRRCANSLLHSGEEISKNCMFIVNLCSPPGPWSNHNLCEILTSSTPASEETVKKYLNVENSETIKIRIQSLIKSNKLQLALRLCNTSVQQIELQQDLFFVDTQLLLLQSLGQVSEIAKNVQSWPSSDGVNIIQRMLKSGIKLGQSDKVSLAECLCNIFLLQDVINCADSCNTKKLMQLWCMIHIYLATEPDILAANVRKIFCKLNHAKSSAHFYLFVDVLYKEFGQSILPLCIELYVRALTVDLNILEAATHKDCIKDEMKIKIHLADIFTRLVNLVKQNDLLSRECLLTAYSLEPTDERLQKIENIALRHEKRNLMIVDDKVWEKKIVPKSCTCGLEDRCSSPLEEEKLVNVPLYERAFCKDSSTNSGCLVPSELLSIEIDGLASQNMQDLIMVLERPRSWLLKWNNEWSKMRDKCKEYEHKVLNSKRITNVPSYNEQLTMYLHTVPSKTELPEIKKEPGVELHSHNTSIDKKFPVIENLNKAKQSHSKSSKRHKKITPEPVPCEMNSTVKKANSQEKKPGQKTSVSSNRYFSNAYMKAIKDNDYLKKLLKISQSTLDNGGENSVSTPKVTYVHAHPTNSQNTSNKIKIGTENGIINNQEVIPQSIINSTVLKTLIAKNVPVVNTVKLPIATSQVEASHSPQKFPHNDVKKLSSNIGIDSSAFNSYKKSLNTDKFKTVLSKPLSTPVRCATVLKNNMSKVFMTPNSNRLALNHSLALKSDQCLPKTDSPKPSCSELNGGSFATFSKMVPHPTKIVKNETIKPVVAMIDGNGKIVLIENKNDALSNKKPTFSHAANLMNSTEKPTAVPVNQKKIDYNSTNTSEGLASNISEIVARHIETQKLEISRQASLNSDKCKRKNRRKLNTNPMILMPKSKNDELSIPYQNISNPNWKTSVANFTKPKEIPTVNNSTFPVQNTIDVNNIPVVSSHHLSNIKLDSYENLLRDFEKHCENNSDGKKLNKNAATISYDANTKEKESHLEAKLPSFNDMFSKYPVVCSFNPDKNESSMQRSLELPNVNKTSTETKSDSHGGVNVSINSFDLTKNVCQRFKEVVGDQLQETIANSRNLSPDTATTTNSTSVSDSNRIGFNNIVKVVTNPSCSTTNSVSYSATLVNDQVSVSNGTAVTVSTSSKQSTINQNVTATCKSFPNINPIVKTTTISSTNSQVLMNGNSGNYELSSTRNSNLKPALDGVCSKFKSDFETNTYSNERVTSVERLFEKDQSNFSCISITDIPEKKCSSNSQLNTNSSLSEENKAVSEQVSSTVNDNEEINKPSVILSSKSLSDENKGISTYKSNNMLIDNEKSNESSLDSIVSNTNTKCASLEELAMANDSSALDDEPSDSNEDVSEKLEIKISVNNEINNSTEAEDELENQVSIPLEKAETESSSSALDDYGDTEDSIESAKHFRIPPNELIHVSTTDKMEVIHSKGPCQYLQQEQKNEENSSGDNADDIKSKTNGTTSNFRWFGVRKQYTDIKFCKNEGRVNSFVHRKDMERKNLKENGNILKVEKLLKISDDKNNLYTVLKLPKFNFDKNLKIKLSSDLPAKQNGSCMDHTNRENLLSQTSAEMKYVNNDESEHGGASVSQNIKLDVCDNKDSTDVLNDGGNKSPSIEGDDAKNVETKPEESQKRKRGRPKGSFKKVHGRRVMSNAQKKSAKSESCSNSTYASNRKSSNLYNEINDSSTSDQKENLLITQRFLPNLSDNTKADEETKHKRSPKDLPEKSPINKKPRVEIRNVPVTRSDIRRLRYQNSSNEVVCKKINQSDIKSNAFNCVVKVEKVNCNNPYTITPTRRSCRLKKAKVFD